MENVKCHCKTRQISASDKEASLIGWMTKASSKKTTSAFAKA